VSSESEDKSGSPAKGIARRALRSGMWVWGRQLVTNVVSIFTTAILARHLSPSAFGVVALSYVVIKFLAILGRSGVADYVVVDRGEDRERRISAAFWLNTALSLVVAGLCVAVQPIVVRAYDSEVLGQILLVMVGNYVIDQLGLVPEALVKRTLRYEKLAVRDASLKMFASIASAALAVAGFGVWSLILPTIVVHPVRLIVILWISRFRPRLQLGLSEWPRIWRFSINTMVANLATTIVNDSDNLVIGRFIDKASVGIYNIAWSINSLVSANTVGVVGVLALPSLAASATDMPRLRAAFARMLRALALLSFPAYVGMFVLAEEFVLTLYGPAFEASVLPLRILIVFAMRRAVTSPMQTVFSVLGRPEIGARLGVAFVPIFLASILVGVQWGVVGVAVAVTVSRTFWGMLTFRAISRLLEVDPWDGWRQVSPVFASAVTMGTVVAAVRWPLVHFLAPPAVVVLVSMAAFGALAYLLLLRYVFASVREDVLAITKQMSKKLHGVARRLLGAA
jgi:PST family polysaccharide transporter